MKKKMQRKEMFCNMQIDFWACLENSIPVTLKQYPETTKQK